MSLFRSALPRGWYKGCLTKGHLRNYGPHLPVTLHVLYVLQSHKSSSFHPEALTEINFPVGKNAHWVNFASIPKYASFNLVLWLTIGALPCCRSWGKPVVLQTGMGSSSHLPLPGQSCEMVGDVYRHEHAHLIRVWKLTREGLILGWKTGEFDGCPRRVEKQNPA